MAVQLAEHRAVRGRRGEEDRDPVAYQRGQQMVRPRLLQQQRRGPGAQREDQQAAEAEGEAERRAAREHVVGERSQHAGGEGVGDGEQVPVEVHTALGASGGPRSERDEGDLVGGRVDRPVGAGAGVRGRQPGEVAGAAAAEQGGPQAVHVRVGQARPLRQARRLRQVLRRPRVAQRVAHLGQRADGGQFARPRLRQYGHRHRARLHDGEPARRQPGRGGPAQQHPVPGHHPQVLGEHMGDAVHRLPQLAVAPHAPVGGAQRGTVRAPLLHRAVQQLVPAVQPVGVAQPWIVQEELRPLLRRWQMVAREGVGVRTGDAYGRVGGGCGRVRRGIRLHQGSPPCRLRSVSFG